MYGRHDKESPMALTSPRREPLADQVIAQLRAQITSGEWPVGSRIPTEVELVEQLGVARNTVREAVRALAHNGLLDIRQGSGTYVLATSELAGVMHRRFADADAGQVVELREALEAAAARLAATRRTDRDLRLLDTALGRREDAWTSGDVESFVQTDAAFHQAVMAAAHNEVLSALYADLGEVLRSELRQNVGPELEPHRYVGHSGILAAIRDGDAERASLETIAGLTGCRI
jgi:DNA-binding FadR family transcriptional regulator